MSAELTLRRTAPSFIGAGCRGKRNVFVIGGLKEGKAGRFFDLAALPLGKICLHLSEGSEKERTYLIGDAGAACLWEIALPRGISEHPGLGEMLILHRFFVFIREQGISRPLFLLTGDSLSPLAPELIRRIESVNGQIILLFDSLPGAGGLFGAGRKLLNDKALLIGAGSMESLLRLQSGGYEKKSVYLPEGFDPSPGEDFDPEAFSRGFLRANGLSKGGYYLFEGPYLKKEHLQLVIREYLSANLSVPLLLLPDLEDQKAGLVRAERFEDGYLKLAFLEKRERRALRRFCRAALHPLRSGRLIYESLYDAPVNLFLAGRGVQETALRCGRYYFEKEGSLKRLLVKADALPPPGAARLHEQGIALAMRYEKGACAAALRSLLERAGEMRGQS